MRDIHVAGIGDLTAGHHTLRFAEGLPLRQMRSVGVDAPLDHTAINPIGAEIPRRVGIGHPRRIVVLDGPACGQNDAGEFAVDIIEQLVLQRAPREHHTRSDDRVEGGGTACAVQIGEKDSIGARR